MMDGGRFFSLIFKKHMIFIFPFLGTAKDFLFLFYVQQRIFFAICVIVIFPGLVEDILGWGYFCGGQ